MFRTRAVLLAVTGVPVDVQVAVVAVLAKALCGGALVLAFAALSQGLKPKRFAGIFAAAPSVAIAGLSVGAAANGPAEQVAAARTMLAGAVALAVCAAVLVPVSRRWGAGKASVIGGLVWLVVAAALYPVID
jgi:hypothetical protein